MRKGHCQSYAARLKNAIARRMTQIERATPMPTTTGVVRTPISVAGKDSQSMLGCLHRNRNRSCLSKEKRITQQATAEYRRKGNQRTNSRTKPRSQTTHPTTKSCEHIFPLSVTQLND